LTVSFRHLNVILRHETKLRSDGTVDGTRLRRTRDDARKLWYASYRQRRFARFVWGLSLVQAPRPAQGRARPISFAGLGEAPIEVSLAIGVAGYEE
jgi:hypothetical protein